MGVGLCKALFAALQKWIPFLTALNKPLIPAACQAQRCAARFFCAARVWGDGWGGQCGRPALPGEAQFVLHATEVAERAGFLFTRGLLYRRGRHGGCVFLLLYLGLPLGNLETAENRRWVPFGFPVQKDSLEQDTPISICELWHLTR